MNDEDVIMLHLDGFTEEAEALARKIRFMWEGRERIAPAKKQPSERKAPVAA